MDEQLDQGSLGEGKPLCERCLAEMTMKEVHLASEDTLHICMVCREAVLHMRTAVKKAFNGRFRTGI